MHVKSQTLFTSGFFYVLWMFQKVMLSSLKIPPANVFCKIFGYGNIIMLTLRSEQKFDKFDSVVPQVFQQGSDDIV